MTCYLRSVHPPIDERFDAKWMVEPNTGCHIWLAGVSGDGYGAFKVGKKQTGAHRYAWERKNGPIPDGLEIDHYVCDSPLCVNPDHLRPATPRENTLRSRNPAATNAKKTHCPHGHPYAGENLIVTSLQRFCRICVRAAGRRHDAKRGNAWGRRRSAAR